LFTTRHPGRAGAGAEGSGGGGGASSSGYYTYINFVQVQGSYAHFWPPLWRILAPGAVLGFYTHQLCDLTKKNTSAIQNKAKDKQRTTAKPAAHL
jgi:hypothetical protein